jgi:RNA polymerase sigma factor (sigma-70 family)
MPGKSVSKLLQHLYPLAAGPKVDGPSDQQLLAQFVSQRQEAAFAALLARHGPMVLGVCRRIAQDEHLAEDAFQATFLVLARKAPAIRKQQAVGSWLHGVALRLARKARTAAIRAKPTEAPNSSPAPDPASAAMKREAHAILQEELQRLPDNYRLPLALCYLEGRTREEAAAQLGWTSGQLKGVLERARERLRSRLLRRGVTLTTAAVASALTDLAQSATVPSALLATTLTAGLRYAAGDPLSGCGVAAPVIALIQGEFEIMASKTGWFLVGGMVVFLLLGSGVVLIAQQNSSLPAGSSSPKTQAQAKQAQQSGDKKEPQESTWGVEVDGVQCRLQADKLQWQVGEVPTFRVDVRNRGSRQDLSLVANALAHQVQVDKGLCDWRGAGQAQPKALAPGQQVDNISFRLGEGWLLGAHFSNPPPITRVRSVDTTAKLKVSPGRHIVRVAIYVTGKDKTWIRALSNPVAIEVVGPGQKPAERKVQTSVKAIQKGLSLLIQLDKKVFQPEDVIDLRFTLRNESGKVLYVSDGSLGPDYQEVGPARHFEVHITPRGQQPLNFWSGMMTEGDTAGIRKVFRLEPGETYTGTLRLSAGATNDRKYAYRPHEEQGGQFATKGTDKKHVLGKDARQYSVALVYQVNPETHGVYLPPKGFKEDLLWKGKLTSRPLSFAIGGQRQK